MKNFNLTPQIPNQLGNMTINELMSDPNTEISKKGNHLSLRRINDDIIATLDIQSIDEYKELRISKVPRRDRKSEYLSTILELQSQGVSQKDIAYRLNISPSYVSQLLSE